MQKIHEEKVLETIRDHKRTASFYLDSNPSKNNLKLSEQDSAMYLGWFKNGINRTLAAIEEAVPKLKSKIFKKLIFPEKKTLRDLKREVKNKAKSKIEEAGSNFLDIVDSVVNAAMDKKESMALKTLKLKQVNLKNNL